MWQSLLDAPLKQLLMKLERRVCHYKSFFQAPFCFWTIRLHLTVNIFHWFPTVKSATGVANAVIPTFTTFQYPPMLRTRAMGIANFSAGFALVTVPYIWLLVRTAISTSIHCSIIKFNVPHSNLLFIQKYIVPYLPPLLLSICGIVGAIALFFIEDKTAIMMSADRQRQHHQDSKLQPIQTGWEPLQKCIEFKKKKIFEKTINVYVIMKYVD